MPADTVDTIPAPPKPTGRYVVELFDADSGELVDRVESENYITPLWQKYLAGLQYSNPWWAPWLADTSILYRTDVSLGSAANPLSAAGGPWYGRLWNPQSVSPLPQDSLIITDDDTAEDPTDHWIRGCVIAWATRWKSTVSAAGKRGQINEAESAFSNNGRTHKTVWDFTTQQGNGTFQTLGIGAVNAYGNPANPTTWLAHGPHSIILDDSTPAVYAAVASPMMSTPCIANGRMYWVTHNTNSQTADAFVYSLDPDDVFGATALTNDPTTLDARGLPPASECDTGLNFTGFPSSNNSTASPVAASRMALCKLGDAGDFVVAYTGWNSGSSTATSGRTVRIRRFTTAGSLVYENTTLLAADSENINAGQFGLSFDGTHLYLTVGGGSAGMRGNVYRLNPADGTVSATIPIPGGSLVDSKTGSFLYDGSLFVGTEAGILRMSTAGALVSPYCYGYPDVNLPSETGLSPWATSPTLYYGAWVGRGPWGLTPARVGVDSSSTAVSNVTTGQTGGSGPVVNLQSYTTTESTLGLRGVFEYAGKLWRVANQFAGAPFNASSGACLVGITGANALSRTVLESAVTKTSSQNMKITYEITFPQPSDLVRWHDHRSLDVTP
jgi:hypothetical protein